MSKITKRLVDATDPNPAKRVYVWDTEIRGFGLQVLPSGVKSYVYQYRTKDGTERRATLGKHGSITADEARSKADDMRRAVIDGKDPLAEKAATAKAKTVADVLDDYLVSKAFTDKAEGTKASDRGRINRHLKPLLGRQKIDALTPETVAKAYADIAAGKTAIREKTGPRALARVRGGEGAARKSIRLLKSTLAWAKRERLIAVNPIEDISTGIDGSRDIILDDADAYGRLFKVLQTMEAEKRIRAAAADAIRVIALTGARRGEIAGMRWKHVDLKKGLVTLPSAAHKTGKKTGKPRVIGLPAAAQAYIARQPVGDSDDYVFAPAHGAGPIVLSKLWTKIRVEANLPDGIGLHGLRHSLASHMAMGGAQAFEIMTALGHRDISTSEGYVNWARDRRQEVAERAASVALAGIAAATGTKTADVIPLKDAAR